MEKKSFEEKSLEEKLEHFRARFSATIGTTGTKLGLSINEAIKTFQLINLFIF